MLTLSSIECHRNVNTSLPSGDRILVFTSTPQGVKRDGRLLTECTAAIGKQTHLITVLLAEAVSKKN